MAGNESDLLKRATQAMMSRDEEGDHIDSDTPRSGFATPQPDLSDKRLPGIMHSYFGQSSSGSGAVPVSTPRGKLTVKILEARGLRRCRDPYVVAVFQRNELVSKGPRIEDEEEDEEMNSIPRGGIPISRQGSDSGRPMAIPMKSRQSSNTSLSEYRDFKSKSRRSFTNPKWDTEAV
ncbi:hypothetical protein DH86_00003075, partial [Scytalidium sp. 3C]